MVLDRVADDSTFGELLGDGLVAEFIRHLARVVGRQSSSDALLGDGLAQLAVCEEQADAQRISHGWLRLARERWRRLGRLPVMGG